MDICSAFLLLITFLLIFIAGVGLGVSIVHPTSRTRRDPAQDIHHAGLEARQAMDQASDDLLRQVQNQINKQQEVSHEQER